MRSDCVPDLFSLAQMAQDPHADLRPILLRIQTQTFVSAQSRDRRSASDYEAIALGLIPLVTDDVLAETAAILRTIANPPQAVLRALVARLDGPARPDLPTTELAKPVSLDDERADFAILADGELRLDGHRLASLVERARSRPALARALLARPEPGIADRAALYRFADRAMRAAIRTDAALHLARTAPSRPRSPNGAAERIAAIATGQRPDRLVPFIAAELPFRCRHSLDLDDEAGGELFMLALRALDLPADECIQLLLGLDWSGSRSPEIVFGLASVARASTPEVATFLLDIQDGDTRPATDTRPGEFREVDRSRRGAQAAHRPEDSGRTVSRTQAGRGSGRIVRAGHR